LIYPILGNLPVDEHDLSEACPFEILLKYAFHVHLDNPVVIGFGQIANAKYGNQGCGNRINVSSALTENA
jgi:hypothetical protein